jgi:hypothetical protein
VSISIALVNRDVTVALFGGFSIIPSHERRRLTISDAAVAEDLKKVLAGIMAKLLGLVLWD